MSIRIDPASGLKVFNTRAAKATDRIAGKGYSIVSDESLKTLPELPPGATFNAEEQAKYREFKDARRGAADYMAMEGEFAKYLDDVYSAQPIARDALTDECEILVVGAGFAGLLLWHKLQAAGFRDVRFCEKGGDVGGTWYWNRYPGIACDVEAYSYLPLLEEMGYVPTMKFASGFEILEYCQKMADKFGFYEHCLFHTTVQQTVWDEAAGRWIVTTDRGDAMRARFVILANGILTTPKLARIEGMQSVPGRGFSHVALELPRRSERQDGRHHRHRRHRRAGDSRTREGRQGTLRVSTHAVVDRHPRSARDDRRRAARVGCGTRLVPRTARAIREDLRGTDRDSGERRLSRRPRSRFQRAQTARADAQPRRIARQTARLELPHHGADPRARGRDRQRSKNRGGVETVLPVWLQASDVSRRVPAGLQSAARPPRRHGADRRASDQRKRRCARRRRISAGRADLCDGFPVDGDVDVQHDHRSRRPHADAEVGDRRARRRFSGCTATASRTCSSSRVRKAAAAASTSPMRSTRTATTSSGCSRRCATAASAIVDVRQEPENEYAEHCRQVDIATAPLRDCISYYNGEGGAEPGSLAYYGGNRWHKYRVQAQSTLAPFVFGAVG